MVNESAEGKRRIFDQRLNRTTIEAGGPAKTKALKRIGGGRRMMIAPSGAPLRNKKRKVTCRKAESTS